MAGKLFDSFVRYGQQFEAEKGDIIFKPGDSEWRNCAFFLESGVVALATVTREGEEKVYLYFNGQRLIGFAQILRSMDLEEGCGWNRKVGHAEIFLIARSHCVLRSMREVDFKRLINEDSDFNRMVLQVLTANYVELLDHFQQALEESASTRFCRLLLESYVEKNGMKVIPRSMTFLEMSKYLGTHPVTVSRIVAALKRDGCIEKIDGRVVIMDEERLMRLIMTGEEIK